MKGEFILRLKVKDKVDSLAKGLDIDTTDYLEKTIRVLEESPHKDSNDFEVDTMIKNALENIDEADTDWTYLASRIMLENLYTRVSQNRGYDTELKYGDFYDLIDMLVEKGIYSSELNFKYTKEEIDYLGTKLVKERDMLFDYLGIYTLATRYLATDHDKNLFELPQERWMIIAMWIMQDEDKDKRLSLIEEAYWAMSNLYMTVATPTMNNAGKTHGQLSSCFINTVSDSLQSIYDVNSDVAQLSKNGGGIGVYMGKVRGRGSSIKGFKGMSSGVVPWVRQLNNTAVSVDQLGKQLPLAN